MTNAFELAYQGSVSNLIGGTNYGQIIVVREKEAQPGPNGSWNRTYGFADGHTEIHMAADGDFTAWENQHMVAPSDGQ